MKLQTLSVIAAVAAMGIPPAQAATTIIGDSVTVACARAAMASPQSAPAQREALQDCDAALAGKLTAQDRTATLVNRGIVQAAAGRTDAAIGDFADALARDPHLASAYVSRGAALMQLGRYAEARADFDRALSLNAARPELAYFNRGMANEKLGDLTAAYRDYRQAAMLAPGFAPANVELARFQVVPRRVAQNR